MGENKRLPKFVYSNGVLENIDLYEPDVPYAISNEEFEVLNKKFGKLVFYKSKMVAACQKSQSLYHDISQEIFISLFEGASKYKRQRFVVSCIEWFCRYPFLIPKNKSAKYWVASYIWQVRDCLGPVHGFGDDYERFIRDSIVDVDSAPPDFEQEPIYVVYNYIKNNYAKKIKDKKSVSKCIEFIDCVDCFLDMENIPPDLLLKARKMCKGLIYLYDQFSPYAVKPCRSRAFFMDDHFPKYIKQFIFNQGEKEGSRIYKSRMMDVGSINLDEFSDMIPDTKPESCRLISGRQHDFIISKMDSLNDSNIFNKFSEKEVYLEC